MKMRLILCLALWTGTYCSAAEDAAAPAFYAQACFYGAPDPRFNTPADQMHLLAELGYDGYSQFGLDGFPEVLKAIQENHLHLFQLYAFVSVDPEVKPSYDPRLPDAIAALKGSDTMIGLILIGKPPTALEYEPYAVATVQQIADMAAAAGLRVALYPHQSNWIERVQDALRVAKKTERKNVGVVFSEVHFFLVDDENNLDQTIRDAAPLLYVVNINGTDSRSDRSLAHVLQPLGRGSFDNLRLLRLLRENNYAGPIGLHCYAIKGDVPDNLAQSRAAWQDLCRRLHESDTPANQ